MIWDVDVVVVVAYMCNCHTCGILDGLIGFESLQVYVSVWDIIVNFIICLFGNLFGRAFMA